MTFLASILLLLQFLTGAGLLLWLRPVQSRVSFVALSLLVGLGISSVVPLVLEVAAIPLRRTIVFPAVFLLMMLCNFNTVRKLSHLKQVFSQKGRGFQLCELPLLGLVGYLLFISAWKAAWFANISFDAIVGPDLVATYAVREEQLVSSVFTKHLPTASLYSNQPFYAPFTAMSQIMYLLTGLPFGKLWLTALVVAFNLFLYAELRRLVHPLLLTLLFAVYWCTPELFAYTFLIQTDYSNMAFFAASVWLLHRYFTTSKTGVLATSILLMTLACWTRTETFFFVPIGVGFVFQKEYKQNWRRAVKLSIGMILFPALTLLCWNVGFMHWYLPTAANTGSSLLTFASFDYQKTFTAMNKDVILRPDYWNYLIPFFGTLTLINLLFFRDRRGLFFLIWLIGLYLIFGLILQHINGANVAYTFRRGFFKAIPLMVMYLASSTLFQKMSQWLDSINLSPNGHSHTPQQNK
ncbi:hypothetical protein [Tellurirhabdus bombi]|uniref:hypothetical protein n=1 Tax=Tellurirhabdus bombi TaxID=2907205 RepID=UPI001F3A091F|nr:hypothetical protein [Tellurirhabdus bombi]